LVRNVSELSLSSEFNDFAGKELFGMKKGLFGSGFESIDEEGKVSEVFGRVIAENYLLTVKG
jgi:hypothetical protein